MRRSSPLAATAARSLTIASLVIALAACETTYEPPPRARSGFDPGDVAWARQRGDNTIVGTAQLRAGDGVSRSCAALSVRLAPDSSYTRDRVERLYGDADSAFVTATEAKQARAEAGGEVAKAYEKSLKAARCDAHGRFAFENLPDGTYYVMAPVVWKGKLGEVSEGGFFMQRVTVEGGETVRLAMNEP
jgi:hypothetical protein